MATEELDWPLGQILDKFGQLDLGEQTLVIWTSDNGAPLASGVNPDSPHYSPRRGNNLPLHSPGYITAEGTFVLTIHTPKRKNNFM